MKSYTICDKGGVRIFVEGEGSLGIAPNASAPIQENLLRSMRFVADLIAGKIDNKGEEVDLMGFITVAVEVLTVLSVRLGESKPEKKYEVVYSLLDIIDKIRKL